MFESLVTALFKFLAEIIAGFFLDYSPARLIRRFFWGVPLSDTGEGFMTMFWRGLFDVLSWVVVIGLILKAFGGW